MVQKKNKLKVFSLGGLNEIGKNITVFEYDKDIFVVDCGVSFPMEDMLGIDLVIPDFTYLENNIHRVKGLVLTHGHEDHIGAVPYFLKKLPVKVYGTKLTLGLLENKLKEHKILSTTSLNPVSAGSNIKLGCFIIEFIRVTHSIADSVSLAIKTPVGVVVHSGDFKVDYTPIHGEIIDLHRFAELGKAGVLLFLCESTNIFQLGHTMSEKTVGTIFDQIFEDTSNQRIMVATFSSNVHRIQQIVNSAKKQNRKVAIVGRSMTNAVRTASELGYLDIPKNILIDISDINNYTDKQLVIITTGSQGEPMAALSRIATSDHKQIEIKPGDKIILSSHPIPGNEKTISRVINELMKKGAEVISEGMMNIHVSGHANQEEIKLLHALIRPKYFVPIHGEFRHLCKHKEIAIELGMNKENIFIMGVGDVLELNDNAARLNGSVPSGDILVDGLGVGDVGNIVLRDRKHLSNDGLVIAVIAIDKATSSIVSGPDIISRGFVYVRESEQLISEAKRLVRNIVNTYDNKTKAEWSNIKFRVKEALREYLWQKIKRSPMILPIIMEI